ncbi:MAG: alpha/beta hydrolase [Planctomycetota bacterium]|nr:alpha/beta hydrolase [Planctomycetota bacterium]
MVWRMVLTVSLAAAAATAGGCGMEAALVYFPTKVIDRTPADEKVPYETVTITTSDGLKLEAWYMPPAKPDGPVILHFHGNSGDLSNRVGLFELFHPLGLGLLVIDYRGFGRSEGSPTEAGTYLDAQAAWKYLTQTRGIAPSRIFLQGQSLGGGVASELATRVKPGGLILEATFTSLTDEAADMLWFLPVRLLMRTWYPTRDRLATIDCPVLVLHSREDGIIPFHHGQDLYQAAREPKRFVEITGGHNTGIYECQKVYLSAIRQFIDDSLSGHWPASAPAAK